MIKNIVFDLGNVLVDYDPSRIVDYVFSEKYERDLILKEIFNSKGWRLLDKGVIRSKEHHRNLVSRYPGYAKEIEWILNNWYKDLPAISGMNALIQALNELGFKLYILSNAGYRYYNYALSKNEIFKFFSGITISAELELLKPDKVIYDQFCEIHNLKAKECLFIDDKIENVQAAIDSGWQAYKFKCPVDLLTYLEENLGINIKLSEIPKE